jgi:branched-chain amino acid transport system permease protein
MRFRPEGIVPNRRRQLEFHADDTVTAGKAGA